jgi:hypothetical protein
MAASGVRGKYMKATKMPDDIHARLIVKEEKILFFQKIEIFSSSKS